MDLHPTFGRHELFETLSQGSRSSQQSNKGGGQQQATASSDGSGRGGGGGGGNQNQQQQSQQSQQDEAAIRLLGHKLSMQAHEGPAFANDRHHDHHHAGFRWSPISPSCFVRYGTEGRPNPDREEEEDDEQTPYHAAGGPPPSVGTPFRKVSKKQLNDHAHHHHAEYDHHDDDDDDRMSVDHHYQHRHHHHSPHDDELQQQQQEGGASFFGTGRAVRTTPLLTNGRCRRPITKRLTIQCKECYEAISAQQQQRQQHRSSSSLLSQQSQRFSSSWNNNMSNGQHHQQQPQRRGTGTTGGRGILASVMESTSLSGGGGGGGNGQDSASKNSRATQSISTKDTNTRYSKNSNTNTTNNNGNNNNTTAINQQQGSQSTNHNNNDYNNGLSPSSQQQQQLLPRGDCLTEPSMGTANDGDDNEDGNLIVYEHDMISVPRKALRMLDTNNNNHNNGQSSMSRSNSTANKKSSSSAAAAPAAAPTSSYSTLRGSADFRVLKRCGQGTFAQVFEVLHLQTNDILALKVIKNKPAYTRQAAIEIDIYQTLRSSSSSCQQQQQQKPNNVSGMLSSDYMVHLHAYFMHKNHLCLVFELLGSNLYEALKRRQFRGLSVSLVQTIMRQALFGIKELATKNIVHCDLKPENILLTSDEATRRVVQSGMVASGGGPQQRNTNHDGNNSSTTSMISVNTIQSSPMAVVNTSEHSSQVVGPHNDDGSSSRRSNNNNEVNTASSAGGSNNGFVSQASSSSATKVASNNDIKIKLIDFGSACFEGLTAHTYIQSRFYRCPEVLLGLPYDSSIDMWSLGCIAAELFLGLPILPGMHEHDQMRRITEMIAPIPDWMLEQGSKATKCYVKYFPRNSPSPTINGSSSPAPSLQPKWRLKTQHEYVVALSQSEVRKRGGLDKLNRPNNNRYFKRDKLSEIIYLHAQHSRGIDRNLVRSFVHFLYGLLDPDPWKRLTAFQASQHPFITDDLDQLLPSTARPSDIPIKELNQANLLTDSYWKPPWDPSVCRRKLLNVQKLREKQNSHRLGARSSNRGPSMLAPQYEEQRAVGADQQVIVSPQSSEAPAQISSSCSNSSSYPGVFPNGPNQQQTHVVGQQQQQKQQQQNTTGPLNAPFQAMHSDYSVNDYSSFASSNQGFGRTIERPGVVPANYSVSTCNTQSIGYGSVQSESIQNAPQFMLQNHLQPSWQSNAGTGLPNGGTPSVAGDLMHQQQHHFLDHVSVRSTASSISDATMITDTQPYQTFLAQQQQQQQLWLAQQQQQQQFGGFPNGMNYQQQMAMQFDQQQQQQMPAQVVMPGGGTYFYMVDPSSGQPILLQAVGFPNQLPTGQPSFVVVPQQLGHHTIIPNNNSHSQPPPPGGYNPRPTQPSTHHGGAYRHEITSSRSGRRRTSRGGMSM